MESNKIQKYSAYKPSSADWLGVIPEHWESIRMKHLFRDYSEKNRPNSELLSVTQDQGVVPRTWVENRMVMPSGALESFKFINEGDFAISLRSFEGGLEYCYHDGIISPAYTVLKAKIIINNQFYKYLFKSKSFISELQTSVVGIRQGKNISYPELSYSYLPIPPIEEQTAIARFLDRKTALIDQAIGIKEKQIELLKERRQILIHGAVTRGLYPDVKLKDSGVEWIGEIPEHWEVKRIKHLGKIINGYAFNSAEFRNEGTRVMKIANIQTMSIDWSDESFIDDKYYNQLSQFQINRGDFVFALTRPIISTGIKAAIVDSDDKILLNQRNAVLKPSAKVEKMWLYYIVLDTMFTQTFDKQIDKTGQQPNISTCSIGSIQIPFANIKEQEKIVSFIGVITAKIANAISLKEQEIEKLEEYKASLINSAVTGKIKVK